VAAFAGAVGLLEESAACVAEGPATVAFVSDVLFALFVRAITGAVEASRAGFHSTKVSPGCGAMEVDGGYPRVSVAPCVVPLVAEKICCREGRDFLTAV
jgi:hypothetical protein